MMTPLKIKILLHYYCSFTDYPGSYSPVYREAVKEFVAAGLLERNDKKDGPEFVACRDAMGVYVDALFAAI